MYECESYTKNDNYVKELAYDSTEFNFDLLKAEKKGKSKYIELPATYDIETSKYCTDKINEKYASFMYHWQMCVEGSVIFGRTWDSFLEFLDALKEKYQLDKKKRLVIYVHNLSYEFQFMYRFFEFTDVFATDTHSILTCKTEHFEFRCSYKLSNMNLAKFISDTEGTYHFKAKDDLNYDEVRTPNTELTPKELGYCYNDVKGLYEALSTLLKTDTLDTIPLTSTGYVRRDARNNMRKNRKNRDIFLKTRLDLKQYLLCREIFRGGNTAGSRYLTNMILDNVGSWDLSSSYPFQMVAQYYPMGKFMYTSVEDIDELEYYNDNYCTIGRYVFENIRVKKTTPIPYIPISKCTALSPKPTAYNGRLMDADNITIGLTNIDYDIIVNQYDFDAVYVYDFYVTRRGYLPKELIDTIFDYFTKKSTLKGLEDFYYEYMKSKNKLNGIYGMSVTDLLHAVFEFSEGEYIQKPKSVEDMEKELDDFYKNRNNFLPYQWGIFVTAHARALLQKGIDRVGLDVVYVDTDSVKYVGDHTQDFLDINAEIREQCKRTKRKYSITINDKTFEMGTYEQEHSYDKFITLGAKKYAFEIDGKIGITVAGLSKKLGAKELEKSGGLTAFKKGKIFYDSGRTVAQYNNDDIHYITIDGCKIKTASNVAIIDTTYTLGISDTMLSIIEISQNYC